MCVSTLSIELLAANGGRMDSLVDLEEESQFHSIFFRYRFALPFARGNIFRASHRYWLHPRVIIYENSDFVVICPLRQKSGCTIAASK